MAINFEHLKSFNFVQLLNECGWDGLRVGMDRDVGGQTYTLLPVAVKRGVQILHCQPGPDGAIPPYGIRQQIERKVTSEAREHLIIFTDAAKTRQIWQWVSRAPGRPAQYREVKWQVGQDTNLLEQKLRAISFDLEEENSLSVFGIAERLRHGFDRDTVTKKFYTTFQTQRNAFQNFINGIPDDDNARWYTAVVIDRLMFLWFLQEEAFLDNDKRYLQNRLTRHVAANAPTSFYKAFLCPLFFRGFAEERTDSNRATIAAEFGDVPYLNGGLFAEHDLERQYGDAIDIADDAFVALFRFFDQWDWHLDDRPLASGKEINPDVLGYIFEKFVNQKQMGAYYTKEDITEYIAKNTIIPCLLDKVRREAPSRFDTYVWPILAEDPRRYIYPAMLHGIDLDYPAEIKVGFDTEAPGLLERRKAWNKQAPATHALPTEIWRETIARHEHTRELFGKLENGEICSIDDLITWNLDIRQVAQDVIERCSDPSLLNGFWVALAGRLPRKSNEKLRHGLTVLDPTCGSGAFLFAALQVMKPLYQACITAMNGLLIDEAINGRPLGDKWREVEEIVERFGGVLTDRERDYAITKHIIVHNLYGVDIEAQATEIAKLRLFLKLVALLEPGDHIEPLPDIDFNIRAGNTLVGYASAEQTKEALDGLKQGNLFADGWDEIQTKLVAVEEAYHNFQLQQVRHGGRVTEENKRSLADQLSGLEDILNSQLCRDYGNNPDDEVGFQKWVATHRPFHWYVDFYPIMATGGFDVVIGNPPFVENRLVRSAYWVCKDCFLTESAGNLYALCMERSALHLCRSSFSMIVPHGLTALDDAKPIRECLMKVFSSKWVSGYAIRPSKLFEGVDQRVCIFVGHRFGKNGILSGGFRHWNSEERGEVGGQFGTIFNKVRYYPAIVHGPLGRIGHTGSKEAITIISKLEGLGDQRIGQYISSSGPDLFHYHRSPRYWIRAMDFEPYFRSETRARSIHHFRDVHVISKKAASAVCALINSSLFFWWFINLSNGRNVTGPDISFFPVGNIDSVAPKLEPLNVELMADYRGNSVIRKRVDCEFQEFRPSLSKPILDEIDSVLSGHYWFSQNELDYLINYDIKYRMGLNGEDEDTGD